MSHPVLLNGLMLAKDFLDGLWAEARGKVVVAISAKALTPTLSQRERESNCTGLKFVQRELGSLSAALSSVSVQF